MFYHDPALENCFSSLKAFNDIPRIPSQPRPLYQFSAEEQGSILLLLYVARHQRKLLELAAQRGALTEGDEHALLPPEFAEQAAIDESIAYLGRALDES